MQTRHGSKARNGEETCIDRTVPMEKRPKYQDLAADLSCQNPGYKVHVVPVVMGDLGTVGRLK